MNLQSSWEDRSNELESENKLRAILSGANFQSIKFRNVPIIMDWLG